MPKLQFLQSTRIFSNQKSLSLRFEVSINWHFPIPQEVLNQNLEDLRKLNSILRANRPIRSEVFIGVVFCEHHKKEK